MKLNKYYEYSGFIFRPISLVQQDEDYTIEIDDWIGVAPEAWPTAETRPIFPKKSEGNRVYKIGYKVYYDISSIHESLVESAEASNMMELVNQAETANAFIIPFKYTSERRKLTKMFLEFKKHFIETK